MDVSPQVRDIIDLLSAYAGGRLHDAATLGRLLQHAADRDRPAAIGDLAFKAKYLTRLQLTLRRQTPESELYGKLEEEFSRTIHEFHAMVGSFVEDAETELREMITRHHLAVTQEALHHLMQLAEDLTWLKNWELEMEQTSNAAAGSAGPTDQGARGHASRDHGPADGTGGAGSRER